MMGSQKTESLVGLVAAVTDPQKFQANVQKLQEATARHDEARAAADEATRQAQLAKSDAAQHAHDVQVYVDQETAKVTQLQSELERRYNTWQGEKVAHEKDVALREIALKQGQETLTAAVLAHRDVVAKHQADVAQHAQALTERTKVLNAKESELRNTEARLATKSQSLAKREAEVAGGEHALRDKHAKIKELLG